MKTNETKTIGTVTDTTRAVTNYRAEPGNFDNAARAAVHYARRDNKVYVLIKGNSYGHFVWHIASVTDDARKFLINKPVEGATAKPDGTISRCTIEKD